MEIQLEEGDDWSLTLTRFMVVGKIIANRVLNRRGVVSILRGIWSEEVAPCIREIKENMYSISFKSEKEVEKVLMDGPWVEDPISRGGLGRGFLRLRVGLEVSKPLVEGFWVPRQNREKVWAEVKYERLADFCYTCGRIGHVSRKCGEESEAMDENGKPRFGPHMRAAPARDVSWNRGNVGSSSYKIGSRREATKFDQAAVARESLNASENEDNKENLVARNARKGKGVAHEEGCCQLKQKNNVNNVVLTQFAGANMQQWMGQSQVMEIQRKEAYCGGISMHAVLDKHDTVLVDRNILVDKPMLEHTATTHSLPFNIPLDVQSEAFNFDNRPPGNMMLEEELNSSFANPVVLSQTLALHNNTADVPPEFSPPNQTVGPLPSLNTNNNLNNLPSISIHLASPASEQSVLPIDEPGVPELPYDESGVHGLLYHEHGVPELPYVEPGDPELPIAESDIPELFSRFYVFDRNLNSYVPVQQSEFNIADIGVNNEGNVVGSRLDAFIHSRRQMRITDRDNEEDHSSGLRRLELKRGLDEEGEGSTAMKRMRVSTQNVWSTTNDSLGIGVENISGGCSKGKKVSRKTSGARRGRPRRVVWSRKQVEELCLFEVPVQESSKIGVREVSISMDGGFAFAEGGGDTEVVNPDGSKYRISWIYGAPVFNDRKVVWDRLKRKSLSIEGPWMCVGDMNDIVADSEKEGGPPKDRRYIQNFKTMIEFCQLMEVPTNGQSFTWSGVRDGMVIKERLDRCLVNLDWFELSERSKKKFKYEATWNESEDCKRIIREGWELAVDGNPTYKVVCKLKRCRSLLKNWCKEKDKHKKSKENLIKAIADINDKGDSLEDRDLVKDLESRLRNIWQEEETYWHQRARVNWLKCGDSNTKYFHQTTLKRRQFNKILKLKKGDEWIEKEDEIMGEFLRYYEGLFTTRGDRDWDRVLQCVPEVVTREMNESLLVSITDEEVKQAVFQMGELKSLGPDGFNGQFFQTHWEVVQEDICNMVKNFFRSGKILKEINCTEIVLIPKVKSPESVTQFRPISLCNYIYKIISKLMVNRMKQFMGSLVTEEQSAFVEGRQIHDNVLVAQEVFHYLRVKKRGGSYDVAIKIDMSKAYDRVEWDFLYALLLKLGFLSCPELSHLLFADDSLFFMKADPDNCGKLFDILQEYSAASGQEINLEKSNLIFSSNTPQEHESERKIHWCSWDAMTLPKTEGGMGFKDLEVFNRALLAKQAWRAMNNSNALWVKVLKGIYFPNSDFMKAKKGARASWSWHSLLDGRDFLNDHIQWQVGNGAQIHIWDDKWVPDIGRLTASGNFSSQKPDKVAEIINHNQRVWDIEPVKQWITKDEQDAICRIPLGVFEREDKRVWPHNTSGQYSVKSGYFILKNNMSSSQNPNRASSSHNVDHTIWKFIWKLTCPNKIKTFLWRCCRNALPTAMGLFKRNCRDSGLCSICGQGEETIEHILLTCDWTRGVWLCVCGLIIDMQGLSTFDKWLDQLRKMLTDSEDGGRQMLTKIAFVCWIIWKVRCEVVIAEEKLQHVQVVYRIQKAIGDFELANFIADKRQVIKNDQQVVQRWSKPELGWLKYNCDGSFCKDTKNFGNGVVVRNHSGHILEGIGMTVDGSSALCAEALALREAVQLAVKSGVQNAVFEIDSAELFTNVQQRIVSKQDWHISHIIQDIQSMLPCLDKSMVRKVSRSANLAADWFAKQSRRKMSCSGWRQFPPSSLVGIWNKDGVSAPP
ncbi:reverse transcriptase [Corchorus capsularis]|uniref:Reverse transcriptase n=1 Tax=Corchorus capsularis TaxID=210143 RepID=A0A1R3HAV4_COCAP|nr:reverse transcriptase [Corchorus capsularis]